MRKLCTYLSSFSTLLLASLTFNSEKFSQAIEIEPTNHVLYSNRSGAYASLKDFDKALTDANKTTEIKPDWAKGWSRKGAALHGINDLRKSSLTAFRDDGLRALLESTDSSNKSVRMMHMKKL